MIDNYKIKYSQKNHIISHNSLNPGNCLIKDDSNIVKTLSNPLVNYDNGRTHFKIPLSEESQFKSSVKLVDHRLYSDEIKEIQKRHIEPYSKNDDDRIRNYKRHYYHLPPKISPDVSHLPHPDWKSKRFITPNESKLYDMESYINRKTRVNTRDQQRNYIPEINPGDKFYKDADHEPDFYKKGGLIVGSTIQTRKSAKPAFKKSIERTSRSSGILLNSMSFEDKLKHQMNEYDKEEIRRLNNGFNYYGKDMPSWEDRNDKRLITDDNDDD